MKGEQRLIRIRTITAAAIGNTSYTIYNQLQRQGNICSGLPILGLQKQLCIYIGLYIMLYLEFSCHFGHRDEVISKIICFFLKGELIDENASI